MKTRGCWTSSILRAWLIGLIAGLASTLLYATPQAGWWWNPAESGRGFFLEVQGDRMFMAGYFYGNDGKPTWLVSNDPMPQQNRYDGRLLAFHDGQQLLGDYRHPSPASDAGAVSLTFTDDTHGTLTWPGGMVPIERQDVHHGPAAAFQPKTGWWWNPDESGRGFSMELAGDHMFIGAYMYDESGNAEWYVADNTMQSATKFSGPLLRFANGQTMGGTYRAPTPPEIVGSITVDFSAPDRATVTLSDDRPSKAHRNIIILPQYELKPVLPHKAAEMWVGGFDHHRVTNFGVLVNKDNVEVTVMTWEQEDTAGLDLGYPAYYKIASGFAVIDTDQVDQNCSITGATSTNLSDGNLVVQADGSYTGTVRLTYTMPVTETCVIEGHSFVQHFDFHDDFQFPFAGVLQGGVMKGPVLDPKIPNTTFSGSWEFNPRN